MTTDETKHTATVQPAEASRAIVPGLGYVTVASYVLQGNIPSNEHSFDLPLDVPLSADNPFVVMVQPRQSYNGDSWWHDQFAVQVIKTSANNITVRVRRIDQETGWGQQLRLDVVIVEEQLA